ncbi:unnamed protein product [Lepidochelys olivacea]
MPRAGRPKTLLRLQRPRTSPAEPRRLRSRVPPPPLPTSLPFRESQELHLPACPGAASALSGPGKGAGFRGCYYCACSVRAPLVLPPPPPAPNVTSAACDAGGRPSRCASALGSVLGGGSVINPPVPGRGGLSPAGTRPPGSARPRPERRPSFPPADPVLPWDRGEKWLQRSQFRGR